MKIVFMGTPDAAVPSLQRLVDDGHRIAGVYTQPDRPSGRGKRIVFSPVKVLALDLGLPLFQPERIRTPEALTEFASLNADIAVVVAYGRILPESFLAAFPRGAVNLHFSLLPKYRGAAPVNWAIVNGETTTGVTTIQMNAGLDTGDLLLSRETEIYADETAPELMTRLAKIGSDVLAETITTFDQIAPKPQDDALATFAPIMKRDDGLINWDQSAAEIANRVRGFIPFPGSFTYLNGRKIGIWAARPRVGEWQSFWVPGEIVSVADRRLIVAAGSGTLLEIEELQFEGKSRISAREALNGSQFSVGSLLGTANLPARRSAEKS
ncbi:MAG: methionyl-tRNA formyltransferase [Pyrinomonadaceae bacterium]